MNEPFTGALKQPRRHPVGSIGIVRFVCPHGIRLLESSLGRLRMPTCNRGKYTYAAPSHGLPTPGDTPVTGKERYTGSHLPENSSRSLSSYFDEGGFRLICTPHETEDRGNRTNRSTSTHASPPRSSDTPGQIGPSPLHTHHRQHATTSPGEGHIRFQERLSPKRHPPRERQCTIGNGDRTRHPAQITKTGASPSNIHAEATLVTHTPELNRRRRFLPQARCTSRHPIRALCNGLQDKKSKEEGGLSWSHSGPSRLFRSILVTFESIPVIQVYSGHIRIHPGHSGPSWSHSAPSDHSGPSGLNFGHSGPSGRSGSFGLIFTRSDPSDLNSGHSGPSNLNFGHSDPSGLNPGHLGSIRSKFRSFESIRSKFRSFGSIRSKFRSFGSIPVTFRSILVHAFESIPVIQVYPGSCIRVYPGHIQVYPDSCIRVYPGHSGPSWFMHSGLSRSHSGLSWSHSGPFRSFRSILITFGSIPVIQVYHGSFGSIPALNSSFRSIPAPSDPSWL
ncbi:hypothetical protein CRG98_022479 [Punica granatum]|uniref:Uncharacterized protein n=1 Tax=Punica granatum TaxID=22663 RepID=A0A2I0JLN5_PUNGR|nr:hypothetical protein CRG98_022479 [Punica granatum]